jgi:poly(A) polymerase
MKESTLKRFMRLPQFDEHLELHRLDCLSSHANLDLYNLVSQKLLETPPQEIRPDPLISGDDLIALGFSPGPIFKEILSAVEDQQLDGTIKSHEEAVGFVRSNYRP